ncbi:tumor necrosis factor receptor superfamily member 8 [Talpa occidentalis]|uniref:tumor necrosis factor receptor superfamily member 8 n=1 Tax=Talpa occidentalis TaxID=50954 RepID=UPI0018900AAC|nr:tumor necrosis factor receptor superfamily member 8 [Talpa occidentalis]
MFCATSVSNTCARCLPHSVCPPGMVVKFQGTAQKDTVCEKPSPRTSSKCSASSEDCRAPASTTALAEPSLISPASSEARTMLLGGRTSLAPEDIFKMTPNSLSSEGKPSPDSGLSLQQPCPPGSPDCRKQCDPDYYLDRSGLCMACVTCKREDLVEKTPCMWNADRVCECRPGMTCATSARNSCARCVTNPICPPGMVAKLQGVTDRDTTNEPPTSGTHPDCSPNPEDKSPSSAITPVISKAESQTIKGHEVTSFTESPFLLPGHVFSWVVLMLLVVLAFSAFLLCHRRACRKWIRQKLHLCYPAQTFRPKLEPVDSKPGKKHANRGPKRLLEFPAEVKANRSHPERLVWGRQALLAEMSRELAAALKQRQTHRGRGGKETGGSPFRTGGSWASPQQHHFPCPQELERRFSVAQPVTAELGFTNSPLAETFPAMGADCLESQRLLEASPCGTPPSPTDLSEPRAASASEHTNNRIEKIYIMKADTVIVGTVKTEVPEGRSLVGPASPVEPEFEDLEVDHAPRYPEQETEAPPGSCRDVMFSVEEEGKEDPWPTTASGK